MRRLVLLLALCLGSPAMCSIIPQPREMTAGEGAFRLGPDTALLIQTGEPALRRVIPVAVQVMEALTGGRVALGEADEPRDGAVFLGRLASEENAEDYTLEVTPARIVLLAGGPTGLIHLTWAQAEKLPFWVRSTSISWGRAKATTLDPPARCSGAAVSRPAASFILCPSTRPWKMLTFPRKLATKGLAG